MKVNFVFDEGSSKEDTYLIGENIFGVFDGANSSNKFFDKNGRPGDFMAASILRDGFAKNNGTLNGILKEANRMIMERMHEENIDISDKLNFYSERKSGR